MTRTYPPLEFGPTGDELTTVRYADYEAVGKKLIEWATNGPGSWPKDMAELRAALNGLVTFPAAVTRLTVVQSYDDPSGQNFEFILRLPAKGQVNESLTLAKQGDYQQPPVIAALANMTDPQTGNALSPERQFYARVADYTMRQCR
jgi:hypothetical protein